ncbi:MAG: flavin reductase family protein [Pseudomonadota bacterium]
MLRSLGARPLVVPTPLFLVGSYDEQGKANIMAAAWAGICSSQPPCLTVSLRKSRWTYNSILERGAFTINVPSRGFVRHADYTGIFSGKDEDKFAKLGLTAVAGEHVDAPYVGEFPMVVELKLLQTVELGVHTQFIGEIMDVKVADHCFDDAGRPDITKIDPVIFAPAAKEYYAVGDFLAKAFSAGKSLGNLSDVQK